MRNGIPAAAFLLCSISLGPFAADAGESLCGTVVDGETNRPIAYVTIILDRAAVRVSARDGSFDFGPVASGKHVVTFDHISYRRRVVAVDWPSEAVPLIVALEPARFMVDEIVVRGARIPPGAISINRRDVASSPGNLANDPLRTVQSQPSCAAGGIDFLSKTAVRGGDTEEHGVYFDGYPLRHYAHVGGFAGVVYDDMLEGTVLVPGAAPIRYKGNLSGTVLMKPAEPDTSYLSFRYDITSMAGGVSRVVTPAFSVQASGKTSFFNLPVYQEVGVDERTFRDLLGRIILSSGESITVTTTLLAAVDSETGSAVGAVRPEREVGSLLAGIHLSYRPPGWEVTVRPSYSFYDSRDALSWRLRDREHRLHEMRLYADVSRKGPVLGMRFSGSVGIIRYSGTGGESRDAPFSASAELTLKRARIVSLSLAVGGSREPWTADFEPEAYGALRIHAGDRVGITAGYRRSHQSPFRFSERRYFASIPIDAGDLLGAYAPSWKEAPAVRMDQVSAGAAVTLPHRFALEVSGFRRWYRNLLTWVWEDFPGIAVVGSDGDGRGAGYEIVLARNDPDRVSVMVAVSRARVWKREGTLAEERIGDFDRPDSWQVNLGARISRNARLSLRLVDTDGRPYTSYGTGDTPPGTDEVNALRLPRFRRLDVKFVYEYHHESFEAEFFVDVVNVLNRENIVMMYALEVAPGEFVSLPYGGTAPFPIGGLTIRW
jgi:hypothetical protein